MLIEIPTSNEVATKIKDLFNDKILKPKNMELICIDTLSKDTVIVKIDWKHGELRDVFFLGYLANYKGTLNPKN